MSQTCQSVQAVVRGTDQMLLVEFCRFSAPPFPPLLLQTVSEGRKKQDP